MADVDFSSASTLPSAPLATDYLWAVRSGAVYKVDPTALGPNASALVYGATGDGSTDDTTALQDWLDDLNGRLGVLPPGTYKFSQLSIPNDAKLSAKGAIFRSDGTASSGSLVAIGEGVTFDDLRISLPGTEETDEIVDIGDDFTAESVHIEADAQFGYDQGSNGIIATGVNTRIGKVVTHNIDYPLALINPSATTLATGSIIGLIHATNYLRPLYMQFCGQFNIGGIFATGRSTHAASIPAPGRYQSNLYEGCQDGEVGNIYLSDCGHALRVGGSPHANAVSKNLRFGHIMAVRPRGAGCKINPSRLASAGVTEKAYNIDVAGVYVVDGGDGDIEGNRDLLRLTHCRGVKIGYAYAAMKDETASSQYGLIINDCDDVYIGELGGDNLNSGFVYLDGTNDVDGVSYFGGDVTNLRIGRLIGKCAGANAISVSMSGFNYGDITINCDGIEGFTTRLFYDVAGTLNGNIRILGWVGGSVAPTYVNADNDTRLRVDVEYAGKRSIGRAAHVRHLAQLEVTSAEIDLAATPADGQFGTIFAVGGAGSVTDGAYGGHVILSRPSGPTWRRGAGVVCKQDGAAAANTGLAVMITGTATQASDQLYESALFKANGDLKLNTDGRGIRLNSPDGTEYLLTVSNAGALVIT